MSSPSPFDVSRSIGTNISQGLRASKDESAIENILRQASASGDPGVFQDTITKIISQVSPERQPMALQALGAIYDRVKEREETSQVEALGLKGVPKHLQADVYKTKAKEGRVNVANADISGQTQKMIPQQGQAQVQPQVNLPGIQKPQEPIQQKPVSKLEEIRDKKKKLLPYTGHPDMEVRNRATAELKDLDTQEKLLQKQTIEDKKDEREDRKIARDEEIKFHQESAKYDEELQKNTRIASRQVETIKDITKALDSGNVKPLSWANILKEFGPIGELAAKAFLNGDQATLIASIPSLLEGWKEVFGTRLSDADLKLLQDKLPELGKSVEANKTITKILNKYADQTLIRGKIASEIKEKNKGLRPLGYADQIEKRYDEMTKTVNIRNPQTGRVVPIPVYEASDYIKAGGELVNE